MKDTCALFTEMGSRLTNKISRNLKQVFWEEGRDGWMNGWIVGWLDGWMDGTMAGLKNKHKENRRFLQDFQKLQSHFLACSLVMNNHCCF